MVFINVYIGVNAYKISRGLRTIVPRPMLIEKSAHILSQNHLQILFLAGQQNFGTCITPHFLDFYILFCQYISNNGACHISKCLTEGKIILT